MDDVSRNVHHQPQGNHASSIPETVDNLKWYRLGKETGIELPTHCVAENRCGAQASGWLNGKYPETKHGIVERKICFHFRGNCCGYENTVKIRKCFGDFYVYKFEVLPNSLPGRYCTKINQQIQGWLLFNVDRSHISKFSEETRDCFFEVRN